MYSVMLKVVVGKYLEGKKNEKSRGKKEKKHEESINVNLNPEKGENPEKNKNNFKYNLYLLKL